MLNNRIGERTRIRDGRHVCSLNAGRSPVPAHAAGPAKRREEESASSPKGTTSLGGMRCYCGSK